MRNYGYFYWISVSPHTTNNNNVGDYANPKPSEPILIAISSYSNTTYTHKNKKMKKQHLILCIWIFKHDCHLPSLSRSLHWGSLASPIDWNYSPMIGWSNEWMMEWLSEWELLETNHVCELGRFLTLSTFWMVNFWILLCIPTNKSQTKVNQYINTISSLIFQKAPLSWENPSIGTWEDPVTNWRKRAFSSLHIYDKQNKATNRDIC